MFGFHFDPVYFIGFMLGLVIGTTFHEFMHAYSAYLLGDTTAKRMGRITLNPAAHFDPLGFFMGVLLALGVGFIAWGKPVMVNPYALRFGRRGMAIVAIAGPLANLAFAGVLTPLYRADVGVLSGDVHSVLGFMILINLFLFAFNLIPIPPLDGFNIAVGILSDYWNVILEPIRAYSLQILLGLVFFVPLIGTYLHFSLSPISVALSPIIQLLTDIFLA